MYVPTSNLQPSTFNLQPRHVLGRDWPVAYLFLAPMLLLLFGLIGYPLLNGLRLSLYDVSGVANRGFVGLRNYQSLWASPDFRSMLLLTARFALLSLAGQCAIGLAAALLGLDGLGMDRQRVDGVRVDWQRMDRFGMDRLGVDVGRLRGRHVPDRLVGSLAAQVEEDPRRAR